MSLKELMKTYDFGFQVEENGKLVTEETVDPYFENGCNKLFEGLTLPNQWIMLEMILSMDLLTFMIENYQKQTSYDMSRCRQDMLKLYFEAEGDMQWMERVYPAMMAASKVKPIMKLKGDEVIMQMSEELAAEKNE
jgi:hypothetical protein